MKKIICILFVALLCVLSDNFCVTAFGENEGGSDDFSEIMDEIDGKIRESVDDSVEDILKKNEISVQNPDVSGITPRNVFGQIADSFTDSLKKPLFMLWKIIAVSVIGAIIRSVSDDRNSCERIFRIICIMAVTLIITDTVTDCFVSINKSLVEMNTFLITYVPIFSAVTAAGGAVISSGGYSAAMLFLCECTAFLTSEILLPFMSVILALILVGAINPRLSYGNMADSVKKCTVWCLGGIMTVFVGIMAIQGMTGGAVDNVAGKTMKFAFSSFIPVVGSSVSEAYSAVRASLGVIKNSVGFVGIAVIFIMLLNPFVNIIAVKFVLWAGMVINDIFCQKETAGFLKNVNSVMSVGLGAMTAYALVFIIATSVVMSVALPGGS